jgi:hypothetical protein
MDEVGFVPLSNTGAEMLFEIFSRRYERTSTLDTSNLPALKSKRWKAHGCKNLDEFADEMGSVKSSIAPVWIPSLPRGYVCARSGH